jgi:DNA-binding transcriptional ArsR family regulator
MDVADLAATRFAISPPAPGVRRRPVAGQRAGGGARSLFGDLYPDVAYHAGLLARLFGVTPSAVSQHLTVLHRGGLIGRQRRGRTVLYQRSTLGLALLGRAELGRAELGRAELGRAGS